MARPPTSVRARLSGDAGFGIIEVLVSALIVVLISLAVLGSLDTASRASGTSKAKATAAGLAQEDQDRMQGMKPSDLMSLDTTTPVLIKVGGTAQTVQFSVRSQGQYVLSPATGGGCTNGQRDEYLKIVSTVSWPDMRGRPIRIEGLVAPPLDAVAPGQGSAVLRITRADGITGVADQLVKLVGPNGAQQRTGEEGCAFFANHKVGSYAFEFEAPGYVDPSGVNKVSLPVAVTEQQVASLDALYDQAGQVDNASFVTSADGQILPTKAEQLVMAHPGVKTGGGTRSTTAIVGPVSGMYFASLPGLFPFTSPYSVYSGGQCGKALPPALASAVEAYAGSGGMATLQVQPGQTYSGRDVFEPALNPTVRYQAAPPAPATSFAAQGGARVYFRSTDPACPTPVMQTSQADGKVAERGFPYGTYQVCADYQPATGNRRFSGWQTVTNDLVDGRNLNLDITRGSGSQSCV